MHPPHPLPGSAPAHVVQCVAHQNKLQNLARFLEKVLSFVMRYTYSLFQTILIRKKLLNNLKLHKITRAQQPRKA